jgi:hypothetical protein
LQLPLTFTKRKFLEQDLSRQHKKCAELLRQYYDFLIEEPFLEKEGDSSSARGGRSSAPEKIDSSTNPPLKGVGRKLQF